MPLSRSALVFFKGQAYSLIGIVFKTHFGSSWVENMEAFIEVNKLVDAFGPETVL